MYFLTSLVSGALVVHGHEGLATADLRNQADQRPFLRSDTQAIHQPQPSSTGTVHQPQPASTGTVHQPQPSCTGTVHQPQPFSTGTVHQPQPSGYICYSMPASTLWLYLLQYTSFNPLVISVTVCQPQALNPLVISVIICQPQQSGYI